MTVASDVGGQPTQGENENEFHSPPSRLSFSSPPSPPLLLLSIQLIEAQMKDFRTRMLAESELTYMMHIVEDALEVYISEAINPRPVLFLLPPFLFLPPPSPHLIGPWCHPQPSLFVPHPLRALRRCPHLLRLELPHRSPPLSLGRRHHGRQCRHPQALRARPEHLRHPRQPRAQVPRHQGPPPSDPLLLSPLPSLLRRPPLSSSPSPLLPFQFLRFPSLIRFPQAIKIVSGGPDFAKALLLERYDFIAFTGSSQTGKIIYEAAAQKLTPVLLELGPSPLALIRVLLSFHCVPFHLLLGGKNPVYVARDANIELAARRILKYSSSPYPSSPPLLSPV